MKNIALIYLFNRIDGWIVDAAKLIVRDRAGNAMHFKPIPGTPRYKVRMVAGRKKIDKAAFAAQLRRALTFYRKTAAARQYR